MAKIFLFALILSSYPIFSSTVLVSNGLGSLNNNNMLAETCNAPAPDSFRITSVGGGFISLAWKPAWVGAAHMLIISKKDNTGSWVPQDEIPDISGSSYTVEGLKGGNEYRFRIASKCPSGEVSGLTAYVDGIALIVDLTLLGRTPKNPTPVNCQGIEYLKHNWIGFSISGEGAYNLFEIQVNGINSIPFGYVKRVENNNSIVAANNIGIYPKDNSPIIQGVEPPFQILRLTSSGPDKIGLVNIMESGIIPNAIDLCPVLNDPIYKWKNSYTITALTAKETILSNPGGGDFVSHGIGKLSNKRIYEVQNPFRDNLQVFIQDNNADRVITTLRLLNSQGQIVFTKIIDEVGYQLSLPLAWLFPGIYILQIESNKEIQTFKVLKL